MGRAYSGAVPLLAFALTVGVPEASFAAEEQARSAKLEEVIVTARRQAETLQDVPVTVAALTEQDLERYNITNLTEAGRMVPNMQVYKVGSGNNSNIYLRGIGSSSISAAFDQSVAINLDGVIANVGRLMANGYLDMAQLEVLKGPQSLYFGKSATAGVVSITTQDPGEEFEVEAMVNREFEHDGYQGQFIISSPITETFGARLALGTRNIDELRKNVWPGVENRWRGEESLDGRLTLLWEPTPTFRARTKLAYSSFESDGANTGREHLCVEGDIQPSVALGSGPGTFNVLGFGFDDCEINGNTSMADVLPVLTIGNPYGNGGIPYEEQDTYLASIQLDWDFTEALTLTSVTGYIDLENEEMENHGYHAGFFGASHRNLYETYTQEFRLASDFRGPVNFMLGAFYQDIHQVFNAYQGAVNIGLVALDPATGNGYDYNKNHYLDTEAWSTFVAAYWDITDRLELTAGVRYSDEEKDGYITIPYVHTFLQGTFSAPPLVDGLEFEDDNLSPEVALSFDLTPAVTLFASYKEGFKSGGIDNSALPSASLGGSAEDILELLAYDSEQAEGFEGGVKSYLFDGSVRLNATVFAYDYSDLQVQQFDAEAIQFFTTNASELSTEGLEFDLLWTTPIEGLELRSAWAYTDAQYEEDFFNPDGQNLVGMDRERNAKYAGFVGFSYDRPLAAGWRVNLSSDVRYNDGYTLLAALDPFEQGSFWMWDGAVRAYSPDGRYELSLIGRNLTDEIIAFSSGNRPGACVDNTSTFPTGLGPDGVGGTCATGVLNTDTDQLISSNTGREWLVQFRVRL